MTVANPDALAGHPQLKARGQHATEVDLGAGHIVLDGFPALRERGTAPPPSFGPMSVVATVAHLSYCCALVSE